MIIAIIVLLLHLDVIEGARECGRPIAMEALEARNMSRCLYVE